MTGWLIDCYRRDNHVIVWVKGEDGKNVRLRCAYVSHIYAGLDALPDLKAAGINAIVAKKKTYMGGKGVLKIRVPHLAQFERFVHHMEQITRHRITLYNADIAPEQMFLYEHDLYPFKKVIVGENRIFPLEEGAAVPLRELTVEVMPRLERRQEASFPVRSIAVDGVVFSGPEEDVLRKFAAMFQASDPDVVSIQRAYAVVPYIASRMKKHGIAFSFDRWDPQVLKYRGGRSYWSYNQVRYQDYSVRLHGRLLVDSSTFVGRECDVDGIVEMVQLSGTLFQQTVARSFGAVFQSALVRLMVREGMIIAYKEKPIEPPLSMFDLLKADRGGLTIDPKTGFHHNVAELDFISMFPWLIYNHNISAECLLSDEGPFDEVPGLPVKASLKTKGLIPRALKPFIDRRMYYRSHPSPRNTRRARGLKWVLVSCYGYLRYREFKLGIPTSHMAICAYAREALLTCMHLAEERGFTVIHGIVDCLYISKEGMTVEDVEKFRREVEALTNLPMSYEGTFKWIVFLSSRVDPDRALPATYFGVFENGTVKVRGLEVRQRGVPAVVKALQESALGFMKDCSTEEDIRAQIPHVCAYARAVLSNLSMLKPSLLTVTLMVGQGEYKHNVPQKIIVEKLRGRGITVEPGQSISFIYSKGGPVLADEYQRDPDVRMYKKLFVRALGVLFRPFGWGIEEMRQSLAHEWQMEFAALGKRYDLWDAFLDLPHDQSEELHHAFPFQEMTHRS